MATSNPSTLALMLVVGIMILFEGRNQVFADCEGDVQNLIAKCKSFVLKPGPKVKPSEDCCAVVKKVDVPCVCKYVTPPIELIVSMEKVVYVARTCGVQVPPGMKCGSYMVPPMA
ncbi:Bifunctional inhibitor/plant lipid transfer protein/seed storage helical domain [Dillenia turbinata]|uniref:Bifunctional inhibitor/plant lipid transfer protein/seed storage helical domain n=1 Tax=Dillenia turbinata TaxID=194707 RepID=A0AAN8V917_9MAGN